MDDRALRRATTKGGARSGISSRRRSRLLIIRSARGTDPLCSQTLRHPLGARLLRKWLTLHAVWVTVNRVYQKGGAHVPQPLTSNSSEPGVC
jgi:hypothetical protein